MPNNPYRAKKHVLKSSVDPSRNQRLIRDRERALLGDGENDENTTDASSTWRKLPQPLASRRRKPKLVRQPTTARLMKWPKAITSAMLKGVRKAQQHAKRKVQQRAKRKAQQRAKRRVQQHAEAGGRAE